MRRVKLFIAGSTTEIDRERSFVNDAIVEWNSAYSLSYGHKSLECLWHLVSVFGSGLKISPLLKAKHLGNQTAWELSDALVVGHGRFVETLALRLDAVLTTFQLGL